MRCACCHTFTAATASLRWRWSAPDGGQLPPAAQRILARSARSCRPLGGGRAARLRLRWPPSCSGAYGSARDDDGLLHAGEMGLRRIVFPVAALVLVMIARELLRPYIPVALLNLAVPLFLSLALVRAIVFSLRHAFPRATWLRFRALHQLDCLGLPGALPDRAFRRRSRRSNPSVSRSASRSSTSG